MAERRGFPRSRRVLVAVHDAETRREVVETLTRGATNRAASGSQVFRAAPAGTMAVTATGRSL